MMEDTEGEVGALQPLADRAGGLRPEPRAASQPEALIPSAGIDWWRLHPRFWWANYRVSREWDAVLRRALAEFGAKRVDHYEVVVGPFRVWVENWPYAFGYEYGTRPTDRVLPSATTRRALKRLLSPDPEDKIVRWRSLLAQAIEARRAETERLGATHESAVPQECAQPEPDQ